MTNFVFQTPPPNYDPSYFSRMIRDLRQVFTTLTAIQPTHVATLGITNCPTNGGGLRVGDVYSDSGTLKIVLANVAYVSPTSMTSSLGTVVATGS